MDLANQPIYGTHKFCNGESASFWYWEVATDQDAIDLAYELVGAGIPVVRSQESRNFFEVAA